MNLREYLRNDFSRYIRNRIIGEKCEHCGCSENLHLHHVDKFHNLLMDTLQDLNLNEVDTDDYAENELSSIKYIMLGKQIKCEYKTLCEKCHKILHYNEVKSEEYKEFYYNPYGKYFYVNLQHDFFMNIGIKESDKMKFLYLCTFMDYSNNIILGKSKDKKIAKKDIMEIFKMFGERSNYRTIQVLINYGAIIQVDGEGIIINKDIAIRGCCKFKSKSRLFENAIIHIVKSNKSKSFKLIWNIFRLCNYLNKDNIVSIKGKDTLNVSDIMNLLNYRRYESIKDMQNIKYKNESLLQLIDGRWFINKNLCYNGMLTR